MSTEARMEVPRTADPAPSLIDRAIHDFYPTGTVRRERPLPGSLRADPAGPSRPDPLDAALRVDAACGQFEAAWRAGLSPRIEDFLVEFRGPDRRALLAELLATEIELRRDRGEEPTPGGYRARLPGDEGQVAEVFREAGHAGPFEPGNGGRLGNYELLEEIARGGMGVVYRARQVDLNRIVAVKMILTGRFASEAETRRFRAEAEAVAHLNHPSIVPIHEVGHHDGVPFFSMKFIAGGSLAEHAARHLDAPRASARLIATVARAIHSAHARGIVHRDLKPSNILLDEGGQPLVADFGLAKRLGDDLGLTHSGAPVGTPAYMAPEQAAGRPATAAADVYSLGAILYRLLAGRPPFRGATTAETLALIAEAEPPSPRLVRPEVPRDLALVCLKCLEKEPGDRYPSASALADDLERFLRDEGMTIGRMGMGGGLRRWARREPELAFRLLGVAAVAALTQANFLVNPDPDVPVHAGVSAVEAAWLSSSVVFHRLSRPGRCRGWARPAWIATDVLLLTATLRILDASTSSLVVGYPLLIAASGLWSRVRLVWQTTAFAVIGYTLLAVDARARGLAVEGNHHPDILLATMVVSGAVVAHLVRRIWALGAKDDRPPSACSDSNQ